MLGKGDMMSKLERYFHKYRKNIVGINETYITPYGRKKIVYADWTASGRLYIPIENKLLTTFGPFVANPHTEANVTGSTMTSAYHIAQTVIKKHVNADLNKDVLITDGAGMTSVVNKFQRILGLRVHEKLKKTCYMNPKHKPVVFVTHMEHHSNQISWLETIADVVVVEPDENNMVSLVNLRQTVKRYKDRKLKIGAFTACSNVTGIQTPYHQMAKVMHEYGGLCFIDFACSAPYVKIDMRPKDKMEQLDAIYFSPHKFLGGPGTSGVLIFDKCLYKNEVPDHSGGGTVTWTNPWGGRSYFKNIEKREDGGTPDYLQTIRTALSIKLKEEMSISKIKEREEEIVKLLFEELSKIPQVEILQSKEKDRLAVVSFHIDGIHFNLMTKLLCDRYGIQVRGGCSCAGTYGHYLFGLSKQKSKIIKDEIDKGDISKKPGWVRISLHPVMKNSEIRYISQAINEIIVNIDYWKDEYYYDKKKNEYFHKGMDINLNIENWFNL